MRARTSRGPPRRNWSPPATCARTIRKSSARCDGSCGNIWSRRAARIGEGLFPARSAGPVVMGERWSPADIALINPGFELRLLSIHGPYRPGELGHVGLRLAEPGHASVAHG